MLVFIGKLSLSTIRWVPHARVSVTFQVFASFCMDQISNARALYKYDIPVGFPPGITSILSRASYSWQVIPGGNPTGMSYLFYSTEQIQNTKGGKLQTPEILDKYSSSALLN